MQEVITKLNPQANKDMAEIIETKYSIGDNVIAIKNGKTFQGVVDRIECILLLKDNIEYECISYNVVCEDFTLFNVDEINLTKAL